ncbi:MAG: HpcH/HpaI aldolase family protein, partial [Candidatus Asgardarchaeia archaeon]
MNKLKDSLKNNSACFGAWIQIPHPTIIEIMANNCTNNLKWICIDMEHGVIGMESMTNLIRTIERFDITPIVRIPKNDYIWIHRVLDAGAKGLIIPMIKNHSEAEQAVGEALYPPLGRRSFGYSRANWYGSDFDNYVRNANNEISIILQIEHVDAMVDLDFILSVKGIDGTFIGPYDLSGSLGKPGDFESKDYKNILSFYQERSKEHNIPMGIHVVRPTVEKIKEATIQGYRM